MNIEATEPKYPARRFDRFIAALAGVAVAACRTVTVITGVDLPPPPPPPPPVLTPEQAEIAALKAQLGAIHEDQRQKEAAKRAYERSKNLNSRDSVTRTSEQIFVLGDALFAAAEPRVRRPNDPTYEESLAFGFWGLVGSHEVNVDEICRGRPVTKVQAETTFGDMMRSCFTLGIYYPRTARVWCGREP